MRYLKKIFFIVFVVVFLGSCEKGLDLVPNDEISEATFFKTPNDFKLYSNYFYRFLPSFSWGSENNGDLACGSGGNSVSRGEHQVSDYNSFWNTSYEMIRRANIVLSKLEAADEALKTGASVYAGEAAFFRAKAYFEITSTFGDVPLILIPLDTKSEELKGTRVARIEVMKQVIKDLDFAIERLPKQSEMSAKDNGRLTKGAALALKSRACLFEGTWQKFHNGSDANDFLGLAIDAAGKVISNGEYELWDKRDVLGDDSYKHLFLLDAVQTNSGGFTKADNKEYILSNRFDKDLRGHSAAITTIGGQLPTLKFADMFLCTDGLPVDRSPLFEGRETFESEYQNRDPRMTTLFYIPGHRYWNHAQAAWNRDWSDPYSETHGFINKVEWGSRTVTGYISAKFLSEVAPPLGTDWPVIRYAEVLLNYVEAVYEKGDMISNEDLDLSINKLRNRVGLPALTNEFATANNLDIQEEIRRERAIELSYEGFRYNDLRRWKTAEIELPQALKGVKYVGTEFETHEWTVGLESDFDEDGHIIIEQASTRNFDPEKHYLLPLPRREVQLTDMEQNPNWE